MEIIKAPAKRPKSALAFVMGSPKPSPKNQDAKRESSMGADVAGLSPIKSMKLWKYHCRPVVRDAGVSARLPHALPVPPARRDSPDPPHGSRGLRALPASGQDADVKTQKSRD
jgi:hypothetical protein